MQPNSNVQGILASQPSVPQTVENRVERRRWASQALLITAMVLVALIVVGSFLAGVIGSILVSPYMSLICIVGLLCTLGLTITALLMQRTAQQRREVETGQEGLFLPAADSTTPTSTPTPPTSTSPAQDVGPVREDLRSEIINNFDLTHQLPPSLTASGTTSVNVYTHKDNSQVRLSSLHLESHNSLILKHLKRAPRLTLLPVEATLDQLHHPHHNPPLTSLSLAVGGDTWHRAVARTGQQPSRLPGVWFIDIPTNTTQTPLIMCWDPFSMYPDHPPYDSPATHPLHGPFSYEAQKEMFQEMLKSFLSVGIKTVAIPAGALLSPTSILNEPYVDPMDSLDPEPQERILWALFSAIDTLTREHPSEPFGLDVILYDTRHNPVRHYTK